MRPHSGRKLLTSNGKAGFRNPPLSTRDEHFLLVDKEMNVAFRFGAEQADKPRACDDLRYSMTDLACRALTPIKLASWGHVSEMCRSISSDNRPWYFFKADHEAAYKQLPLAPGQSKLAVVALRSPSDGRRYGFIRKSLMFGAVSAVIHYNVLSRILAELMCRIFGIPAISYFDDFGALLPACLATQGLSVFTRWCALMGIGLETIKSEVGDNITFPGLIGTFPSPGNGMKLQATLTPEKAKRWTQIIRQHLKAFLLSARELEKLIGKLCFSQTCLSANSLVRSSDAFTRSSTQGVTYRT